MKRKYLALAVCLLLCAVCLCAGTAEDQPETFICGDYQYILRKDGSAEITKYSGKEGALLIPSEMDGHPVTGIGDKAFSWCSSLTSVTIPDSVTSIGDSAFYLCSSLTSVMIPDSVTDMGDNPFLGCYLLKTILISPDHPYLAVIGDALFSKPDKRLICYLNSSTATSYAIPQGIQVIGDFAFAVCSDLTNVTIPDSVTSIGNEAFSWCGGLTSVTIPKSVTDMGDNPFLRCDQLKTILISPDHPYLAVIGDALFSKPDKRLICYLKSSAASSYTIPQGILQIGDYAFYDCESLTSVTIPDSVTSIGDYAFYNCDILTSVTIPASVTSIGEAAFAYCGGLTSVTIPDGVTSIGYTAFSWCSGLTSVTIPDSVTSIGKDAFYDCPDLTLTVPRGGYAAKYCEENGLRYIYPDSLDWLND